MKNKSIAFLCCMMMLASAKNLSAQQINVGSPFNSSGSSFFESFGTNFGFSLPGGGFGNRSRVVGLAPGGFAIPNVTFTQNGSNTAIPSFGGFDPNAGATFGFAGRSRNGGGYSLGLRLAQGSTRNSVTAVPNLTLPNGGLGSLSQGGFRPFVTGVTPVLGGMDNAVTRAVASGQLRPYDPGRRKRYREIPGSEESTDVAKVSSAATGAPSLAEIRQRKEMAKAAKQQLLDELMKKAQSAAESGDRSGARMELLKALRETEDPQLKRQIKERMKRLRQR